MEPCPALEKRLESIVHLKQLRRPALFQALSRSIISLQSCPKNAFVKCIILQSSDLNAFTLRISIVGRMAVDVLS